MSSEDAKEKNPLSSEEIQACFSRVSGGTGLLDGAVFEGRTTEGGKAEPEPNTIIFRDGAMLSTGSMPYGFGAGPYTAERTPNGSIRFSSEIPSLDHPMESQFWEGTLNGNEVRGTMIWRNRDGSEVRISIEGRRKETL